MKSIEQSCNLGEFGFIEQIRNRFPQPPPPELGIGDDAAIISPTPGSMLLVSTDLLTEGIHFDFNFTTATMLGRKALSVNLSDIAAMGGKPRCFFLSLAVPRNFPQNRLTELMDGMALQAAAHNCILAGGDTCSAADRLTISITIMGEQRSELILKRCGGEVGDDIWVSGTLGDSALGLQLLLQGKRGEELDQHLLSRHINPTPRTRLGLLLAESRLVSAMIDISDGLLADLGHICRNSGYGAWIQLEKLPLSEPFQRHFADRTAIDWRLAACGGEDFELCFIAPQRNRQGVEELAKTAGLPLTVVGTVTKSQKLEACLPNGALFTPTDAGYTHF